VCGYAAPAGVGSAAALWLSAARKGRAEVRVTCTASAPSPPHGSATAFASRWSPWA